MWQGFHTRKQRQTQIEGLRHGWAQSLLRQQLTDFGSGWRGLHGLTGEEMRLLSGNSWAAGGALQDINAAVKTVEADVRVSPELRQKLKELQQYHQETGFLPILMNRDMLAQVNPYTRRALIRHERIHAAHIPNAQHPFFQAAVKQSKGFEASFAHAAEQQFKHGFAYSLGFKPPGAANPLFTSLAQASAAHVHKLYQQQYAGQASKDLMFASEQIAYAHMYDRGFMKRMRAHGFTPDTAGKRPPVLPKYQYKPLPQPLRMTRNKYVAVGGVAAAAAVAVAVMARSDGGETQTTRDRSKKARGARRTSTAL